MAYRAVVFAYYESARFSIPAKQFIDEERTQLESVHGAPSETYCGTVNIQD